MIPLATGSSLHKNAYSHKLSQFDRFVIQDQNSEKYCGKWNSEIFQREAPLSLEIGAGHGDFMLEYTRTHPHLNFVGLDSSSKRGFRAAKKLSHLQSNRLSPFLNFRYLRAKGERIQWIFGESEIDQIFYFFPDPWPKKRHHKRRLFQSPFLTAIYTILKPGGSFFIKTDHSHYAEWMLHHLQSQCLFDIKLKTFHLRKEYPQHYLASFQTKFEKIFLEKKIPIKAFELISRKAYT